MQYCIYGYIIDDDEVGVAIEKSLRQLCINCVVIPVGTGLGTGIELLYLAIFITLHTIYIIVITCVSCDLEILFYEV